MPDRLATVRPGPATVWPGLRTMVDGSLAHPLPALVATITGIINGTTMILGAAAIGWATDHLIVPALAGEDVGRAAWWIAAAAILGVSTIRWMTIIVRGIATGLVQHGSQAGVRRAVVHRYLRLDLPWHRRHPPGRLLSTAVADVDALWLPMVFFYFALGMVVMLVAAMIQLLLRSVVLGLVGIVLVIAVLGLNLLYQRLLGPRAQAAQERRGRLGALTLESIDGGQVVRTLGLADRERDRVGAAARELRDANVSMGAVSSVFDPVIELLPTVGVLGVLAVGARQVESGDLSVGVLVEVVYLLLTISIPLSVISRFLGMLPISTAGRTRIAAVLDSTETTRHGDQVVTPVTGRVVPLVGSQRSPVAEGPVVEGPAAGASTAGEPARPVVGGLALRARGVGYAVGGTPLLTDVHLDIAPGEIVALVGATGSGKSTLVDLLSRQIDPSTGVIEIGGAPAAGLGRGQTAAWLGVVSQTPWLFSGSVRDNLQLEGHPRELRPYTEAELWRSLAAAGADEVVRGLPDGLDTRVGERGARLSGGQRQRLCLARALVREPAALLLDDATSALDPAVERDVLAALARLRGQVTVLVVGGRPSSVLVADRVAFLRAGRLAAVGTHAELLDAEPDYRRILHAYADQGASDE